jgi:alpha-L-fucosidase
MRLLSVADEADGLQYQTEPMEGWPGHIVVEVAKAARASGLKFGVYLSRMGQQSSFFDPKNEILWRQRADATTYFLEDCDCGYVDDLLIAL